jgi:tetratricopeptide (TPR) repeat protein
VKIIAYIRLLRMYLIIFGGLCLSYGIYQEVWYSNVLKEAIKAIQENRFDGRYLEEAEKNFFASEEVIAYDMGVRAYRANNLKQASEHFYEVIRETSPNHTKNRAYHNLGNIMVQLDLPRKAAEMYRESLRLNPTDWESKYNLERLYVFYPKAFPDEGNQASLEEEPGDEKGNKSQMGQYGASRPDI